MAVVTLPLEFDVQVGVGVTCGLVIHECWKDGVFFCGVPRSLPIISEHFGSDGPDDRKIYRPRPEMKRFSFDGNPLLIFLRSMHTSNDSNDLLFVYIYIYLYIIRYYYIATVCRCACASVCSVSRHGRVSFSQLGARADDFTFATSLGKLQGNLRGMFIVP